MPYRIMNARLSRRLGQPDIDLILPAPDHHRLGAVSPISRFMARKLAKRITPPRIKTAPFNNGQIVDVAWRERLSPA